MIKILMFIRGFFRRSDGAARRGTIPASMVAAVLLAAVPGVKMWEGEVLRPYFDVVHVRTVCFGETENIEERLYTPQECSDMLESRLVADYYLPILACRPELANMPEGAQAMMLSAAYNIGVGGWCGSSMSRAIAKDDWPTACDSLLLWDKGRIGGVLQRIKGLTNRRQWERARCMEAIGGI